MVKPSFEWVSACPSCLFFVIFLANRCQESFPRAERGAEKRAVARVERGAVPGKARPAEREKGSRDMGREKAVPPRPQRGWKVVYSFEVKT